MQYDFDQFVDRTNTNCLKYDFARKRGKQEGLLPLWIADMDFQVADPIRQRLLAAVNHGVFGYSEVKEDYFSALYHWYKEGFGWETRAEDLVKTPGVVYAIAMAVQAYTEPGEAVLIQEPVYYPFSSVVRSNGRKLVVNNLLYRDGKYEMDFADFEEKVVKEGVKLFLLCSPHNPIGRVWEEAELKRVGEICRRHGVIVFSDEIHSDFVYEGYRHTVFANIGEEFADMSIIATAPSKSFNLAGLQVSNIWIRSERLRRAFVHAMHASGYDQLNALGLFAAQAAYEGGREWMTQLKAYIQGNLDFCRQFLESRIPRIKLVEPQGTYLIWLDCRGLGLSEKERTDLIENKAKLWLDTGTMFGEAGAGFERINIACQRSTLEEALLRLEKAVKEM